MRLISSVLLCSLFAAAQLDPEQDAADLAALNAERVEQVMKEHTGGQGIVAPPDSMLSDQEAKGMDAGSKKKDFKAETERLMNILINSLYTERDVFLRELVSNSVDALEKVRVLSLKEPKKAYKAGEKDLKILVKVDRDRNRVQIIDTGVGMCSKDLESNLGTVAKSGTHEFMEAAKRGASASNLIGQFGVGFYSAFLVADNVTVVSKCIDEKDQYVWKSSQAGKYSIAKHPRKPDVPHGTTIVLDLKEDATNYANEDTLKSILNRFSEFVPFPIYLGQVRSGGKEPTWAHINADRPLWLRDKNDVTNEEYNEFYKVISKDRNEPLAHTHFRAEGEIEFNSILYLPNKQRRDLYTQTGELSPGGSNIKLYVQRVLISDALEDFLPNWLSFVSGVIDSNDLPLKVDRETLTESRVMRVMKTKVMNKVFELLKQLSKEAEKDTDALRKEEEKMKAGKMTKEEKKDKRKELLELHPAARKFMTFWDMFGQNIVLACVQDTNSRTVTKIQELMRGRPRSDPTTYITLDQYLERIKPGQESIYFLTGDSTEAMLKSPFLEFFNENDIEVILFTGAFDEACLTGGGGRFRNLKFVSVEKNAYKADEFAFLEAGDDARAKKEQSKKLEREHEARIQYYQPLLKWVQDVVGIMRAQSVVVARTLVTSPAMITAPEFGFSASHERLARTSIGQNQAMIDAYAKMKNLELNPAHPVVHNLLERVQALTKKYNEENAKKLNDTIEVLYETATIASGFPARKPHILIDALHKVVQLEIFGGKPPKSFKLDIPKEIYQAVDAKKSEESEETLDDGQVDEEEDDFLVKDEL